MGDYLFNAGNCNNPNISTFCRLVHRGDDMKQLVFLGKTRSGRLGYFTNGILAWHLTPEEFAQPTEWHIENASQLNFEFCEEEQV